MTPPFERTEPQLSNPENAFVPPHKGRSQHQSEYHLITVELLRALQGSRSSIEISRAMGYSYNQVKRWETGEKQLRWDEFCNFCKVLEIPLSEALQRVFQFNQPDPLGFLNHLYSKKYPLLSTDELSKQLHRHSSAIRRYVDGEIHPDLEFVLAFIDLDANHLGAFILILLPPEGGDTLRARFTSENKQVKAEADHPLAAAIQGWLISLEYRALEKHDSSFIAKRVGTSSDVVSNILEKMTQVGTVLQTTDGKFAPNYHAIELSGIDPGLMIKFFKFWYDRGAQYYAHDSISHKGSVRGAGSCRVIPVSQRLSHEINQILIRADAEIRSLMDKAPDDEPLDDVRIILLKAFSSQDF